MIRAETLCEFSTVLLQPDSAGTPVDWAFVVLPPEISAKLPRRGRITVQLWLNEHSFQAMLEPDGQKGHWLPLPQSLLTQLGVCIGERLCIKLAALVDEPRPSLPADFAAALARSPAAQATWHSTTAVAQVDWLHWITSAKQLSTRSKRITDACDMLASGKKRVCCFDPSGFYSKAFKAPVAAGTNQGSGKAEK